MGREGILSIWKNIMQVHKPSGNTGQRSDLSTIYDVVCAVLNPTQYATRDSSSVTEWWKTACDIGFIELPFRHKNIPSPHVARRRLRRCAHHKWVPISMHTCTCSSIIMVLRLAAPELPLWRHDWSPHLCTTNLSSCEIHHHIILLFLTLKFSLRYWYNVKQIGKEKNEIHQPES